MNDNNQPINNPVVSTEATAPTSTPAPTQIETTKSKKVGPIIVTLIIILVVIIGVLYFFASTLNKQAIPTDGSLAGDDSTTTVKPITNTDNDIQSLQNDLNNSTAGVLEQNF